MGKQGINNTKWRTFAENLTNGQCAADAYLAAGYKSTTRASAEAAASRLRRQPEVAAYIREVHATAQEEACQDAAYSLRKTLAYLARILDTSAATVSGDDPLIQHARTFSDGSTSIRIPCKLRALKMYAELAGYLGSHAPSRRDHAPKPIDPADTPMARLIYSIRNQEKPKTPPQTKPDPPLTNLTNATPNPSTTDGRERFPSGSDDSHTALSPSTIDGRDGSPSRSDESHTAHLTTTPETRAHANNPKPTNLTPSGLQSPESIKAATAPYQYLTSAPNTPQANTPTPPDSEPPTFTPRKHPPRIEVHPLADWPDDPVCQSLLRRSKPKVTILR